jgi:hypothetical protein
MSAMEGPPTAEDLHLALQHVLRVTTLPFEALQAIVHKYPDKTAFPFHQGRKALNAALREFGIPAGGPGKAAQKLRSELVMCQIILMTWFKTSQLQSANDLYLKYDFGKRGISLCGS